ncbi:MAG: hypothetical protein GY778_27200 [bacterium]|nr:hypothetical protein [bacterium]
MMKLAGRPVVMAGLVLASAQVGAGAQLDGREPVDDVFYHFMPIAWRDSDNDTYRFGDFGGMTDSLDYLQSLGVTAIWMNPIFPSPAYHGYQHGPGDQINSRLGDEASFLNFVSAAHARSIKVCVDFVVYGISHDSIWFQDAFGNPASPYDGWLAFENASNTQYLGSTYPTWNGDTVGFIHWNLDNPNPTALVTGWAQHWLDPDNDGDPADGLDGYRLDHVWNQYPNGPNGWGYNIDWWEDWDAALETVNPDVFLFAEQADWGSTGADLLSAFDASFTKPFEFAARNALATGTASGLYASMAATLGSLPAGKQFMCIIGDHDVDRLASTIGDGLVKGRAAAAVLLTQPFPPIIYYGDEIGMRGFKANYGSDANDIPMREPFKWNAVAGPPMSNYWVLNGQAFNNAYSQNNDGRSVEEQDGVSGSLLEHYKKLITARKTNVALRRGSYHAVSTSSGNVWSFLRHLDADQTVLVAINLANATVNLDVDLSIATINGGTSTVHDVIAGVDLPTDLTTANQSAYPLTMAPYGYYVLEVDVTPNPAAPQVVDGDLIPTDLGPQSLRATQDNFTSMGDNINEINQLYASLDGGTLRIGVTGNLATDGTGLALFLDTRVGGQNPLDTASFPQPPYGIPEIDGMVLDTGFVPDYIVFVNAWSGTVYVDLYELATGGGGNKRYLGAGTVNDGDGFLNGGSNPNGALVAIDNSNLAGVTDSSAADAGTAVTGFEMEIPSGDLDIDPPDGRIRMMAMLVRNTGYVGNQFLPGLGFGTPELGFVPVDLNAIDNEQFVAMVIAPQPGDWNSDGAVDLVDYARLATCITGPLGGAFGPGCNVFDFDIDVDIDLEDAAFFMQQFSP